MALGEYTGPNTVADIEAVKQKGHGEAGDTGVREFAAGLSCAFPLLPDGLGRDTVRCYVAAVCSSRFQDKPGIGMTTGFAARRWADYDANCKWATDHGLDPIIVSSPPPMLGRINLDTMSPKALAMYAEDTAAIEIAALKREHGLP